MAGNLPARFTRRRSARVAKLADAADLDSERSKPETREAEETCSIGDPRSREIDAATGAEGQSRGNQDAVEVALAKAIEAAATAGRFDVVAQLARELEARRLAHWGNVHALDGKRAGRHP
jgi:hypothetical protein